jgi:hypothetical protein
MMVERPSELGVVSDESKEKGRRNPSAQVLYVPPAALTRFAATRPTAQTLHSPVLEAPADGNRNCEPSCFIAPMNPGEVGSGASASRTHQVCGRIKRQRPARVSPRRAVGF